MRRKLVESNRGTVAAKLVSLHRRLAGRRELCVESCAPLTRLLWLNIEEVKKLFQYVEVPLRLFWLDRQDLTGTRILHWMRREISDIANSINVLSDAGGQLPGIDHRLNRFG